MQILHKINTLLSDKQYYIFHLVRNISNCFNTSIYQIHESYKIYNYMLHIVYNSVIRMIALQRPKSTVIMGFVGPTNITQYKNFKGVLRVVGSTHWITKLNRSIEL